MFKVQDKYNKKIYTVYDVKPNGDNASNTVKFLIYEAIHGWTYAGSFQFVPVEKEKVKI